MTTTTTPPRSSSSSSALRSPSKMSEWVEIIEPRTQEHMFANLTTGECVWDPPVGVPVKKSNDNQWWELFDQNTSRFYYYNAASQTTVWRKPSNQHCDIIPLAKLQTLKQNTEVSAANSGIKSSSSADSTLKRDLSTQTDQMSLTSSRRPSLSSSSSKTPRYSTKLTTSSYVQTTPVDSPRTRRRYRNHHHHHHQQQQQQQQLAQQQQQQQKRHHHHHHNNDSQSAKPESQQRRRTTIAGADSKYYYYSSPPPPPPPPTNPPPPASSSIPPLSSSSSSLLAKQRSLEVLQQSPQKQQHVVVKTDPSISRSVSFVSKKDSPSGRRSIESTPQSGRRKKKTKTEFSATPQTGRKPINSSHTNNNSNADRLSISELVDTGMSTLNDSTSTSSSRYHHHHHQHRRRSSSSSMMTPLQKYILDQAKLSGYRYYGAGKGIGGDDRDSYVESEYDGVYDDSDDFADDEEAGSEDGSRISSSRASSSINDEDDAEDDDDEGVDYLSEPTYNNVVNWPPTTVEEVDAFSEEFDQRMRLGRSNHTSTIPRPGTSYPVAYEVSSLQRPPRTHNNNNSHFVVGSSSSNNNNNGIGSSTLSVSTSIHSSISCESDIEKYAQDNLNVQKRGIFRRKMTVKDILSWTQEGISKPLTCLSEKAAKKEAVELFRLVQIYMGDRKAKQGMTINSVALDVTTGGYSKIPLRDEIFVQLCKQTTDNPRKESLRRGWELMAICLAFFPPSTAFAHCLCGYIARHRDPALDDFPDVGKWPIHVQISHFAGICAKRLERIGENGHLVPRKPSVEDIDQSRLQIFRPSMFGGTLEETLDMQRDRFPHEKLPWILTTLAEQVLQLNGTGTEGIFRVPADMEEVNNLKSRFDQWEVPICVDCHTAASLLKLWFRELYEPLIPDFLYEEAISNPDDPKAVEKIIRQLPETNLAVVMYLVRFLQTFTRPEVVLATKMDSSNIGTVFAPNLLRCPSQDPAVILENTRKEMTFVKTLITTFDASEVES